MNPTLDVQDLVIAFELNAAKDVEEIQVLSTILPPDASERGLLGWQLRLT